MQAALMATQAASNIKGLFGGGGGGGNAAAAAAQQYEYNLALQKQAQEWNEYMYKNRYQMQVEDLEKAGINKLYGLGNAPTVTSATNSVGMPGTVEERNGKMQQLLTGVEIARNWSAQKVEMEKVKQETATEFYNTQLKSLEVVGKQLENALSKKNLDWYDKRQIAELKRTYSEIQANLAGASNAYAQAGSARALANKYNAETNKIGFESVKTKAQADFYKKHPIIAGIAMGGQELEPVLRNGNQLINTILTSRDRRYQTAVNQAKRAGNARNLVAKRKR